MTSNAPILVSQQAREMFIFPLSVGECFVILTEWNVILSWGANVFY